MKSRTLRLAVLGVAVFLMLSAAPAFAGEGGWQFFAAGTYRVIDDVDFNSQLLVNPTFGTATDGTTQFSFVNGTFDLGTGSFQVADPGQYDPIGWVPAVPGPFGVSGTSVFLDQATAGAQSDADFGSTLGAIIGVEKDWRAAGPVMLSCRFSFWVARDDLDTPAPLTLATYDLGLTLADGGDGVINNPTPSSDTDPTLGDDTVFSTAATPGGTTIASATAVRSLDLNLYVFSAGIVGSYARDRFSLRLGTGATLNVARLNSEVGVNVTSGGPATYNWSQTDADTDVAVGWYGGLGVEYQATEKVSVGLDWRYDWVFQDVGTDQVTVDLDGQSLALSITFEF
ncbi:MAG: hypothetical protein GXP31_00160 [Kiritimatiellaeota bacterium]|nr:hypothetical protein [Kiritimatiellota bacterium]